MGDTNPNLAFVFPGQGSQTVGMLADCADESSIRERFAAASDVVGRDLWTLAQEGPADEQALTVNAQPLLLTASCALWFEYLHRGGAVPARLAGHSLGEWSALVAASVIDFESAVRLVHLRGQYMQAAVPAGQGGMAAIIGLGDADVEAACAQVSQPDGWVGAGNYNAPGQVVIAGHAEALAAALVACRAAGAKRALPLAVSAPFHTPLMDPARAALAEAVAAARFAPPKIPVVHNVHGRTEADPEAIKALMLEQITAPVRWVACVQAMEADGIECSVECGPGRVLAGLAKRISPAHAVSPLDSLTALDAVLNKV